MWEQYILVESNMLLYSIKINVGRISAVSVRRVNSMKSVTGAMLYYYYVCHRKLWYFSHQLDMEHTSDLVQIGKLIDEESYNREKKHIMIDDVISIDFLQNWRIVHEVKKSKSVEIASIWQLKYYMWILENKGVEIEKGILDFPKIKKREVVYLEDQDRKEIKNTLKEIEKIIDMSQPPELIRKSICSKCAYYEFCFI